MTLYDIKSIHTEALGNDASQVGVPCLNSVLHPEDNTSRSINTNYLYNNGSAGVDNTSAPSSQVHESLPHHISPYDVLFYSYYGGTMVTMSVITIVGNILVIKAMLRHRYLRMPGNYFLLSLAISDLLLGFVYPIYNTSHMDNLNIKETLGLWPSCTVILTVTLGLLFVSSYNLVGITVTRYMSIRDPLKFEARVTHARSLCSVVSVWVVLLTVAMALYTRIRPPDGYEGICRYELVLKIGDVAATMCFYVVAPLVVMAFMYGHMTLIARKQWYRGYQEIFFRYLPSSVRPGTIEVRTIVAQEMTVGLHKGCHARHVIIKKELRMFRLAATLVGYFALAWTPFVIFQFVTLAANIEVNRWIRATVRLLLHSNSSVNVLIYAGRLAEFRKAIQADLERIRCLQPYRQRHQHPRSHVAMIARPTDCPRQRQPAR